MRTTEARKTILEVLADCEPHALPEDTLLTNVNIRLRPILSQAEFDEHLLWLKSRGMIGAMEGELGDEKVRWHILEAGKTQIG